MCSSKETRWNCPTILTDLELLYEAHRRLKQNMVLLGGITATLWRTPQFQSMLLVLTMSSLHTALSLNLCPASLKPQHIPTLSLLLLLCHMTKRSRSMMMRHHQDRGQSIVRVRGNKKSWCAHAMRDNHPGPATGPQRPLDPCRADTPSASWLRGSSPAECCASGWAKEKKVPSAHVSGWHCFSRVSLSLSASARKKALCVGRTSLCG